MFDWFFTPNNTSSKVIAITIGTIKYCYNKSMKVMKCETERALTERREHEWNELLLICRMSDTKVMNEP